MKITGEMTIAAVLKAAPATKKVFDRHGMGCKGCKGAVAESVTFGARNHGLDPDALVRELNEAAKAAP